MTQSQIDINKDRLFSKVRRYFNGEDDAIYETVQNALRAGMPMILAGERPQLEINVLGHKFSVRDFGVGITDIGRCLSLAESDWDETTDRLSDPAGMGICALLAASVRVKVTSLFGELVIESNRFFDDSDYREQLLDNIDTDIKLDTGTLVEATMHRPASVSKVTSVCRWMFDLDVKVNGSAMRTAPDKPKLFELQLDDSETLSFYSKNPITDYTGYDVTGSNVVWQGKIMRIPRIDAVEVAVDGETVITSVDEALPNNSYVVLPSRITNAVTPRLPTRDCLVADEKTKTFAINLVAGMVNWYSREFDAFLDKAEKEFPDRSEMLEYLTRNGSPYLMKIPRDLVQIKLNNWGLKCVKKHYHWYEDCNDCSSRYVFLDKDDPVHCLDSTVVFLGKDDQGDITKMHSITSCEEQLDTDIVMGPDSKFMPQCAEISTRLDGYEVRAGKFGVVTTRQVLIVELPENHLQKYSPKGFTEPFVAVCPDMKIRTAALHDDVDLPDEILEGAEARNAWSNLQANTKDLRDLDEDAVALGYTEFYDFAKCIAVAKTEERMCETLGFAADVAKQVGYSSDENAEEIWKDIDQTLNSLLTDVTGTLHVGGLISDLTRVLGEPYWERPVSRIEVDMENKNISWSLKDGTRKSKSFTEE